MGSEPTIALPLLDSMVPVFTARAATPAVPVNRFGVMYVPNGMIMQNYLPARSRVRLTNSRQRLGALGRASRTYTDLERPELAYRRPDGPVVRTRKPATRFLTDISPPTSETWLDAGISWIRFWRKKPASIRNWLRSSWRSNRVKPPGLATPDMRALTPTPSVGRGASTPLPTQNNPRLVFERLFGDTGSTDAEKRLGNMRQQKSILDSVMEEASHIQGQLPQGDRTKLTEYLDAIRGVERRIQIAEADHQQLPVVEHPAGIPSSWEDHVKLMLDLQVLAYQCDLTRVITLMMGHEQSGMTYPQIGVPDAHHPISHHQKEPEKVAKTAKINAYHMTMFAYLLEKMRATPDGDGNLLDHMTLIYGAGIADSNTHAPVDIPFILAGGGAGNLKGGRHTRLKDVPLANLHLTLMDQFGIHWDRIGDSTGRVDPSMLRMT